MLEKPFDIEPWFHCPSCNATLSMIGEAGFAFHFEDHSSECPKCSKKIDLWSVMVEAVFTTSSPPAGLALGPLVGPTAVAGRALASTRVITSRAVTS